MSSVIHAEDEMYLYGLQQLGDPALARSNYFRQGSEIHAAVQGLLDWRFGSAGKRSAKVLDFACGYGRSTRFLASQLPPNNIWVSDIYAGAVEFQKHTFGVNGFASRTEPGEVTREGSFDMIFVASLFTHLPAHRFDQWLATLLDWLSPRGVLAFSVHDEAMLTECPMVPEGFVFFPQSESQSLDTAEYGATYVTEAYMARTFERVAGAGWGWKRLPRGLCGEHDLYVLADAAADLDGLTLPSPAVGHVEGMVFSPDGVLELGGWAGARSASGGGGK